MLGKLRGSIGPMESIINRTHRHSKFNCVLREIATWTTPYKLNPVDINGHFRDLFKNRYPNCERVFNSIQKSGKMRITSVEDFLKGPFAAMKEELKRPLQPPPRENRSEKSEVCPLTSTKRKGPGRAERGVKRLAKRQAYRVAVRLGGMHSRCACPHASRCSFGESSCLSGMELSRRRSSVGF